MHKSLVLGAVVQPRRLELKTFKKIRSPARRRQGEESNMKDDTEDRAAKAIFERCIAGPSLARSGSKRTWKNDHSAPTT